MIQTPLVSIICTTYNHQAYIKDALEGFIMQKTTFPFEIIVHDDASTDNTKNIIKEYEAKFPTYFANIYQTENQYSKNTGEVGRIVYHAACGKYVALCEGDDYWTDDLKLQKQVDFLESNVEYSMVCHDAIVINEMTGTSHLFFTSVHKKQICSTKDVFGMHFCPTASILYRREFLNLNNFYFEAKAGDLTLTLLLSLNGLLYRMSDVMSVYRKTSNGMTEINRTNWEKSKINTIEMFNHFNKISDYKYKKYIRIEILLMRSYIYYLKSRSKFKTVILRIYRKILLMERKRLFSD